jgi:N-acetylmuramic acid 6-phosphate etherase
MIASLRATEQRHPMSAGLDAQTPGRVVSILLAGQVEAARAVEDALPAIAAAVELAGERLSAGGRLVYLAAGSPALMALADALEIPQTYGEDPKRFLTILAGGVDLVRDFAGGPEDDGPAAGEDVARAGIGPLDCVVAISASGSTPYVLAGLRAARERGAATVAIANNPGAPLFGDADIAVLLDTGPEVVGGSTRMGAGTAQKIALNIISTALAVSRGHVHDGHMVALRADNAKLRERARRMVEELAGVDAPQASRALEAAGGEVKPAVLVAAGKGSAADARALLAAHDGYLRRALGAE